MVSRAEADDGVHFMRPLSVQCNRPVINVKPTGLNLELRVQILHGAIMTPVAGYSFDKCRPITQDVVDGAVCWEGRGGVGGGVPRQLLSLHFLMRNCRIYAFQFRHDKD